MTAGLIDMDIVAFQCAAGSENEPEDVAVLRADRFVRDILEAVQADSYLGFLTGRDNFRKKVKPDYKANRKDKELPKHLALCRQLLQETWGSLVCEGYEADDALGINQMDESIICSIDKTFSRSQVNTITLLNKSSLKYLNSKVCSSSTNKC